MNFFLINNDIINRLENFNGINLLSHLCKEKLIFQSNSQTNFVFDDY